MKIQKLDTAGYLTPDEIVEFQRLCKETLNKDLTSKEAEDQGSRLIMLFELMLKNKRMAGGNM
jgi:hypothetical protein